MTILVEKSTKKSIFSRSFVILDSQMGIFFDEKNVIFSKNGSEAYKKRIWTVSIFFEILMLTLLDTTLAYFV